MKKLQKRLSCPATKIYFQQGVSAKPAFNDITKRVFASQAQAVDFAKNQEAAKIINTWVESQTNNKIKDLVSPSLLNNNTRVVLVNAIYFLGNWETPFNPNKTQKETFFNEGLFAVTVDMMIAKDYFKYKDIPSLNATAIRLPYKNSDIAMLFILPHSKTGLQSLEDHLKKVAFEEIVEGMNEIKVTVKLPKFRIETEMEMNGVLKAVSWYHNLFT